MTKKKKFEFLFLGHTDVVPANPNYWIYKPFVFNLFNGFIYSRGICDMKGSIFSIFICIRFLLMLNLSTSIAIMLSGDEEGDSKYGIREFLIRLKGRLTVDNCVIGEPTSFNYIADNIRNGRRGSLNFIIRIMGKQSHNAYPIFKGNLCKSLYSFLYVINCSNGHFYNIKVSKTRTNVTPRWVKLYVNIRYSFIEEVILLKDRLKALSYKNAFNLSFKRITSSIPFYKDSTTLLTLIKGVLPNHLIGIERYSGGTSDGRFIRKLSKNMIELGLSNTTIHSNNENSSLYDIYRLSLIYFFILISLFKR
ncbi:M20/M25/M40 family metallo-hydrolase [Candidatus Vidania fulgoroideorum]